MVPSLRSAYRERFHPLGPAVVASFGPTLASQLMLRAHPLQSHTFCIDIKQEHGNSHHEMSWEKEEQGKCTCWQFSGIPALEAFQLWKFPEPDRVCLHSTSPLISLTTTWKKVSPWSTETAGAHELLWRELTETSVEGTVLQRTSSWRDQYFVCSKPLWILALFYLALEPYNAEQ